MSEITHKLEFLGLINYIVDNSTNTSKISQYLLQNKDMITKISSDENKQKEHYTRITFKNESICNKAYSNIIQFSNNLIKWKTRITIVHRLKNEKELKNSSEEYGNKLEQFKKLITKQNHFDEELKLSLDKLSKNEDWILLSGYLNISCIENRLDLVEYFTSRKITCSMFFINQGVCPSFNENNKKIFDCLIESGLYNSSLNGYLISYTKYQNTYAIKKILKYGASPKYNYFEAFYIALSKGNPDIVKMFLEHKIIPDKLNKNYIKNLILMEYDKEVISLLIKYQINILYKDTNLLKWLIDNEFFDIAIQAINLGANIKWVSSRSVLSEEWHHYTKDKFLI
jgi:hypothetical protein